MSQSGQASIERQTLKDFKVLQVGIFGIDVKFDSCHRDVHYRRVS